jgi:hypothetical protein
MTAVPAPTASIRPVVAETTTTLVLLDDHVTVLSDRVNGVTVAVKFMT